MRDDLMVQQQVSTIWQHMVGVICLNQTGRKQVKQVLPILFLVCPTPVHLLNTTPETIKRIIKPLGMVNVREKRLRRMSEDYLKWDGEDATICTVLVSTVRTVTNYFIKNVFLKTLVITN